MNENEFEYEGVKLVAIKSPQPEECIGCYFEGIDINCNQAGFNCQVERNVIFVRKQDANI